MTEAPSRPVVVGVDGSASSTQAVRWAAQEAVRRDVPLVLLSVWTPIPAAVPHAPALSPYEDELIKQGHRWLENAVATAEEAAPGVRTNMLQATGSPAARLIGQSAAADLMVVGSRGLGGFSGLVIGSIAVALATHGLSPVVVVRGEQAESPAPDAPVVVGVDGSPTSRSAIEFAFAAAAARRVPLVAVHAWSDLPVPNGWEMELGPWPEIEQEQAELLEANLADVQARYPDVEVKQALVRDAPTRALLEEAASAQLVVAGSRGRGGFRGLLLGSTSQALIYHSPCPVAVVPPPRG
ncbi:universal stress protein [Promicromonospora sp. NPDC057488]|uniref:universal stress protein n=1 Tax=Promicromonospora sp. NPDC057488 TaxID=3346147 RepID=UPI0036735AA3